MSRAGGKRLEVIKDRIGRGGDRHIRSHALPSPIGELCYKLSEHVRRLVVGGSLGKAFLVSRRSGEPCRRVLGPRGVSLEVGRQKVFVAVGVHQRAICEGEVGVSLMDKLEFRSC